MDMIYWNGLESSYKHPLFLSVDICVSSSLPGRSFTKPGGLGTSYAQNGSAFGMMPIISQNGIAHRIQGASPTGCAVTIIYICLK